MAYGAGSRKLCDSLTRKKPADVLFSDSQLRRCLKTLDLTSIGVGTIVGAGLYVVTGQLARDVAGPAVVVSFLIAAVSAVLSGICYAEFGCRIPKTGSAYVYTYVTLGEVWAFVVGWNMVLEYLIAGAALARAASEYINSLAGGSIYKLFMRVSTWEYSALGPFPDFLAMTLAIFMTAIVSLGARKSSVFNKIVTLVNLLVIVFIICVGLFFVDSENWTQSFSPYGVDGIFTAASSGFFAFVGFDVIATASEEAINPRKSVPLSLVLSLAIGTIAYLGVAITLTLILPYRKLASFAVLAEAFAQIGLPFAKYVVAVGALCATLSGLMATSFAAPRVIYSMAMDGLLCRCFSDVNETTHVPVRANIVVGLLIATLALLFDVKQLVEMLSIGTLIAYTMVAIAVILTRFRPDVESVSHDDRGTKGYIQKWLRNLCSPTPDLRVKEKVAYREMKSSDDDDEDDFDDFEPDFDDPDSDPDPDTGGQTKSSDHVDDGDPDEKELTAEPNAETSYRASLYVTMVAANIVGLCIVITTSVSQLISGEAWAIFLTVLFALMLLVSLIFLMRQPQNTATFPITVPCVPLLPMLTIFVNVLLLLNLSHWTYLRFGIWMGVGAFIYICYGYSNSIEGSKTRQRPYEFIISETPKIEKELKKVQRFGAKKSLNSAPIVTALD